MLFAQLAAVPWRYTYDGIPVIEVGEDSEWLFTLGHVDKASFAAACEAYYQEVCGEPLPGDDPEASIAHVRAWIVPEADFPYGDEWEIRFREGDVDVTVWTRP